MLVACRDCPPSGPQPSRVAGPLEGFTPRSHCGAICRNDAQDMRDTLGNGRTAGWRRGCKRCANGNSTPRSILQMSLRQEMPDLMRN